MVIRATRLTTSTLWEARWCAQPTGRTMPMTFWIARWGARAACPPFGVLLGSAKKAAAGQHAPSSSLIVQRPPFWGQPRRPKALRVDKPNLNLLPEEFPRVLLIRGGFIAVRVYRNNNQIVICFGLPHFIVCLRCMCCISCQSSSVVITWRWLLFFCITFHTLVSVCVALIKAEKPPPG